MERTALYRRALAPLMLGTGIIGLAAAILPQFITVRDNRAFALYWMAVGITALLLTLLLVRRQALGDQEQFWSPPTRRVSEALMPPFIAGFAVAVFLVIYGHAFQSLAWVAGSVWVILYGCALNAAGFFTSRGLALFGRILVLLGSGLLLASPVVPGDVANAAHYLMGTIFGLLQIAYGIYLYFTERKRTA
jgi:hypothetical protein